MTTRIRIMALALAVSGGTCAVFAAFFLYAGFLGSADMLAEFIKTKLSGEQIKAIMLYAGPLSLILIALSLALMSYAPRSKN